MNRKLRIVLIIILASVFVYCSGSIAKTEIEYKQADNIYEESRNENFHIQGNLDSTQLQGSNSSTDSKEYFPDAEVDFEGLVRENPEIVGWIYIPDTNINFPLLRAKNNQKYLSLSYNLKLTNSGSIFMDFRNSSDFSSDNTVIYGHNMKNGGMFGSLKKYADIDYLKEHSYIYIFTNERIIKYRIFAAYKTENDSESYTRDFSENISFKDYLNYVIASAGNNVYEPIEEQAPLMMLSTCTSVSHTERFVVNAVQISERRLSKCIPTKSG